MKKKIFWRFFLSAILVLTLLFVFSQFFSSTISYKKDGRIAKDEKLRMPSFPPLDKAAYDKKMEELANNPQISELKTTSTIEDTTVSNTHIHIQDIKQNLWPVKTVYPNAGAILPFKRIVAYYGNLYSKQMGVLGEYPEAEMLAKLNEEVKKWEAADPNTPVIPALHYIAVVAQEGGGRDGKRRLRMPDSEINKVLAMAEKISALVFLDLQVGFSNLQTEVPLLEKYLKLPNVHLGVDPEFSMKTGIRPGKIVGTYDAADINFAANYLAKIVKENNLSPKVLVVHRYKKTMVTDYQEIKPLPEVQIVMHMDGWGDMKKKIRTYKSVIYPEPVQFTGFKLFYKSDVRGLGTILMTPEDLLKLHPQPIYIQYQ